MDIANDFFLQCFHLFSSKNRKDENYDDLQMSPYVNQGYVFSLFVSRDKIVLPMYC